MKGEASWRRYARLFGANPRADTEDELSFHVEMRMRDYMRRGMTEAAARRAAEARLGDLERVRTECVAEDVAVLRARRRREWLGELRQDVRYGMRMLVRAPSFTAMAVLTLALGIGATTAIFSLVHAVLLAPLPYADPDRIVRVWETSPQGATRNVVSQGNVLDWTARSRSFAPLGAHGHSYGETLTGSGDPMRVTVVQVQPEVLRVLGVSPAVGRSFVDADAAGAGDVVLLSYAFWQDRFGGGAVLDRRIVLNDVPYTVVGVLPRGFAFPQDDIQLWRPLRDVSLSLTERRSHNLLVIGRLAPGAALASAQSEMDAVAATLAREHPEHMTGWGVNVAPLHHDMTADVRPLFRVLLAGAVVVLLIACGNLAGLLLVRAIGREREMAVRGALGAGRGRIARQLLTESVLLALLGGAGAMLIAPLLLRVLVAAAPADIPLLERAAIDSRMLGFAAVVTLGCALLFGLAPALRLMRTDLQAALRGARGGSGARQTQLRGALLVAQVALSVVLLVGAGLFVRSFAALQATDPGFDPNDIVIMDVDLPRTSYPDVPAHVAFYEQLVERVRAVPGVLVAAGTAEPPGGGFEMTFSFSIQDRPASNVSGREDPEQLRAITPGYFDVLRQELVSGRVFDDRDRASSTPVAIINESLARKHWPRENPVGRRIAFRAGESAWLEIVGVVADVRLTSRDVEPVPALYIPYAQKTWPWLSWQSVIARVSPEADPIAIQAALRAALLELDHDLPPQFLRTVEDAFRENIARRTFAMTLVGGFGALALLLSVVGLYGLLAYSVAQQQKEIGVRLALGANGARVVRGVLGRSLALTLLGAAGGLIAAAAVSNVIESLLFGVSPLDVSTYAATVLFVLLVALATALLPAWRAARTSPLTALRSD